MGCIMAIYHICVIVLSNTFGVSIFKTRLNAFVYNIHHAQKSQDRVQLKLESSPAIVYEAFSKRQVTFLLSQD